MRHTRPLTSITADMSTMGTPLPPLPTNVPASATLVPPKRFKIARIIPPGGRNPIKISPETANTTNSTQCLVLGRQLATCDIQLKHSSISRQHAAIYFNNEDGYLYIHDIGGKKGSFVSGKRVPAAQFLRVCDGDVLTFGNAGDDLMFRVDLVEDESSISSSTVSNDNVVTSAANTTIPEGLNGRQKREFEIAAMTQSLDEAPTWTATVPEENGDDENRIDTNRKEIIEQKNLQIEEDAVVRERKIPINNMAILTCGTSEEDSSKASVATSLSVDPAGSRVITGLSNGRVVFWDFGGMDAGHRCFKTIEVDAEVGNQCPLVSLSHSNSGDRFIAASTSATPRIFDRDGNQVMELDKGDVYVVDMSRTSGHTAQVTGAQWHPLERNIVLTSSIDGSVRTWDLENGKLHFGKLTSDKVFRVKNKRGQRTAVSCCSFHPGGRFFACGTSCHSIQVWKCDRVSSRPESAAYDAHGGGIFSLSYSPNGLYIASRAGDNTVKVWQSKNLSKPVAVYTDLPTYHESSNCAFSPIGSLLCVGTSTLPEQGQGMIMIYDFLRKGSSNPVVQFVVEDGTSVVRVSWHAKLNQIFCTLSNGSTRVYYDPSMSRKGALLSTSKAERKKNQLELLLEARVQPSLGDVLTPHALPLFRDSEQKSKRKREKEIRSDPVKSRKPEPPTGGILTGGQTSASVNFTQFVVQSQGVKNRNIAGVDPRDALFKYNEGKNYVEQAYAENKVILAEKTAEEEEEEQNQNASKS